MSLRNGALPSKQSSGWTDILWLYQSRLTRFEARGVILENLAKTAYFDILREVKEQNSRLW